MVQIIDAENLILGRLASYVAKQALMGEKIIVVNSERAVISGQRKQIESKYLARIARGSVEAGPFYPKRADMIVRRAIRGMLPFKSPRGKKAFKRVMCHLGIPPQYASQKIETLENASADKLKAGYITVAQISHRIGGQ